MPRALALALVALVLAGCTAPAPTGGPLQGHEPAAPTPGPSMDRVGASSAAAPSSPAPPSGVAPPGSASSSDAPASANATGPPAPPANASEPAGSADGNGSAQPSSAPASPPPAPAPPPPPAAESVPVLRVGDRWIFRGVDAAGKPLEEERIVAALEDWHGVPAYRLDIRAPQGGRTNHVSREALNPLNETGFEYELLRFPLRAGDAWNFDSERTMNVSGQDASRSYLIRHHVHGNVTVLGVETVGTFAGSFDAFHVRANLTAGYGSLARWTLMDYWYAPAAKGVVKLESLAQNGQRSWSELMQVLPAQQPG